MSYQKKTLLGMMIALNLLFLMVFALWLFKKINPPSARTENRITQQRKNQPRLAYQTPYYYTQVAHFASLPTSREDIILLGDSLTDQGRWNELSKNPHLKNRGISGDTTDGIINRIDRIVAGQPKKIFILIGANDFWQEKKPIADLIGNYKVILDTLQQKAPNTKVYVQSLLPVNNTNFDISLDNSTLSECNRQLEQLVKNYPYQYINLYPHLLNKEGQLDLKYTTDGVHLKAQGYFVWKNLIEKYIDE